MRADKRTTVSPPPALVSRQSAGLAKQLGFQGLAGCLVAYSLAGSLEVIGLEGSEMR